MDAVMPFSEAIDAGVWNRQPELRFADAPQVAQAGAAAALAEPG